jgi:hypothetical protein
MPVIQRLLERWGFVKLRRYGLARTPDGRILSTRPAILDDGSGGRIVGWQDDDLAMAELAPWEPGAQNAQPRIAPRPLPGLVPAGAPPPRAAPALLAAPVPATVPPVITTVSVPAPAAAQPPPAAMPVEVAAEAPVDDDDWEWMIALARVRAEEALPARTAALTRTRPMATVAVKDPAASGEWPETAPIGAIDYDEDSRVGTRPSITAPRPPAEAPAQRVPVTVIPVPTLPTVQGTNPAGRLQPVVRTAVPPASMNRFAKGTAPVDPDADYAAASMPDDTDPNVSVGDRTTPGIAMPPAARPVTLPSIKRRTSPR